MDPGIGLIIKSFSPRAPAVPDPPPKLELQLPHGFLEKPHVRHALKYLPDDEQREKALEVALAWKAKFATQEWKPVVAAIESLREQDSVRMSPDDVDLHQHDAIVDIDNNLLYAVECARAAAATPATAVPQAVIWPGSKRSGLVRKHVDTTSLPLRLAPAPTTLRLRRWDILTTGPVTPLSPMPIGNSFARVPFKDRFTPYIEQSQLSTPVSATLLSPDNTFSPRDAEARTAYKNVKDEIDTIARKYCMARFNADTSEDKDQFLPHTMITAKDIREAARMVLAARRVKLKEAIINDLPDRIRRRAAEETAVLSQLRINDESDLAEQYDWMNNEALMPIPEVHDKRDYVPPPTDFVVSILDEQRETLRMFRRQRESGYLELSKRAVEAAWAVRILEDAERLVEADWDSGSNDDDDGDDGYNYDNFLRSIKSEMSTSTSSGALSSMVDEVSNFDFASGRSLSNTAQTFDSVLSHDSRFPRWNTSFNTHNHWSASQRDSNSSSSHKLSSSGHRRPNLRIATETIGNIPNSELTPEDRDFRHRGPSRADLDLWAEELKKMEAMRTDRQRSPTVHRRLAHRGNQLSAPSNQSSPSKQTVAEDVKTHSAMDPHLHSRFSSFSSSASSSVSQMLPLSSYAEHTPLLASSMDKVENGTTMLDGEHHQRSLSNGSTRSHRRDTTNTSSLHDSVRRRQHVRSTSGLSVLVKRTTKAEEEDWMGELQRMEGREKVRQSEERRRASQS